MARATKATSGETKAATARAAATPSEPSRVKTAAKRAQAAPASSAKAQAKAAPPGKGRAKASPAPIKAPVVTIKHLASALSESRDMPQREAEAFVAELIGAVVSHIKEGAKVRIAGLGILEVKDRPARMARNPATGEQVHVEASRKVAFRPAKDLKEAI